MEFDVWCPDDRILVACPGPDDLGDYDCLGHVDPATVPWQVDGPIRVEIEEFYFLGEADARFVALAREVLQ